MEKFKVNNTNLNCSDDFVLSLQAQYMTARDTKLRDLDKALKSNNSQAIEFAQKVLNNERELQKYILNSNEFKYPMNVINKMRTNGRLLPDPEQGTGWDQTVLPTFKKENVLMEIFDRYDLVESVDGMTNMAYKSIKVSDITGGVKSSMDGIEYPNRVGLQFSESEVPLPIYHIGWSMTARQMAQYNNGASARIALPDGILQVEAASAIANYMEEVFLNGDSTVAWNGNSPEGIQTTNQAVTGNYGTAVWDNASVDSEDIYTDIQTMITALKNANNQRGQLVLLVPFEWKYLFKREYKSSTSDSLTLLQKVNSDEDIASVEFVPRMDEDKVVMFNPDRRILRYIDGMPLTTLNWGEKDGWVMNSQMLTIGAPEFRSDFRGKKGIYVMSAS